MKWVVGVCLLANVLFSTALLSSQVVTFLVLGDFPGADYHSYAIVVSADGSVVAGLGYPESGMPRAFRWEDDQMEGIVGMEQALVMSSDGKVIAGLNERQGIYDPNPQTGVLWDDGVLTVIENILPGDIRFTPTAISADGHRIISESGHLWKDGIITALGASPAGGGLDATGISGDGMVVVGAYTDTKPVNAVRTPFIIQNNVLSELPILPDHNEGEAVAVNFDGSVIVGRSYYRDPETGGGPVQPCRWENGNLVLLEYLEESSYYCWTLDVSGDGNVILGEETLSTEPYHDYVIWTEQNDWKPVSITQLLLDHGYDIYEAFNSIELKRISSDGTTIVGSVTHSWGGRVAVRIQILDMFGQHRIHEGHVDTGAWMGWLNVEFDPWVWCLKTQCWFYIPESNLPESARNSGSGWIYIPALTFSTPELWLVMVDGTSWAYSYGLSKWMYVDPGGSGWVYLIG